MSILDKINPQKEEEEEEKTQSKNITYLDFLKKNIPKANNSIPQTPLFSSTHPKMQEISNLIWQISLTKVPVLIKGEKGSGKKFIAHKIHETSSQQTNNNNMIKIIDCATERDDIIEKNLFSNTEEDNIFLKLNNGTLVLENITSLSSNLQLKLLNLIQEKKIILKKSQASLPITARIVATTSYLNIEDAVKKNLLRQDLYYRLYVIQIDTVPLRERKKDIKLLVQEMLKNFDLYNKELPISEEALEKLNTHHWPLNVQELNRVIKEAVKKATGNTISSYHINLDEVDQQDNINWIKYLPIGETVKTLERHFIIQTLTKHNGNRTHAAKTLGISLRTLRNKINEFTNSGFNVPESASYPSRKTI
jgi:two-component system, NtrC family, response regulator AtoC